MKESDIIKAAQHVKDDLISEAIDYAPIRKHFNWGYIAGAAACAALVAVSVPLVSAKLKSPAEGPGSSSTSSSGAESNSSIVGTVPDITLTPEYPDYPPYIPSGAHIGDGWAINRLRMSDDNTFRTFYDVRAEHEPEDFSEQAKVGSIYLSGTLTECLSKPHDKNDLFAVRLYCYNTAGLKQIYYDFAQKDEKTNWLDDPDSPLFMTEAQLRNLEAPPELALALSLAPMDYREEVVEEYDFFNTTLTDKIYGTVKLRRNSEGETGFAPAEVYQDGHRVVTAEYMAEMKEYIEKFAKSNGIDLNTLYLGNINYENATITGEFDVIAEKFIFDDRVESFTVSNGGGYVYELYGDWLTTRMVAKYQMKKLPAGLTYREIIERLGNTAALGMPKNYRQYVTKDGAVIPLLFDSIDDVCEKSGAELWESALPMIDDDDIMSMDIKGYILSDRSGLFIYAEYSTSPRIASIKVVDIGTANAQIFFEDGTPATVADIKAFSHLSITTTGNGLLTYPEQWDCAKVVILDK